MSERYFEGGSEYPSTEDIEKYRKDGEKLNSWLRGLRDPKTSEERSSLELIKRYWSSVFSSTRVEK